MIKKHQKAEFHIFLGMGKKILYNVLTGDFFEIDDVAHEVLKIFDGRNSEKILEELSTKYPGDLLIQTLEKLEAREVLMENVISPAAFHPPERLEIIHLAFQITHDCNLNCKYCYLMQVEQSDIPRIGTGIKKRPGFYMDLETAYKAIDLLIRESGKLEILYVSFYGGESLLNFSLLYNIIEYGKRQAAKGGEIILFDLNTNGALLNRRILRYLAKSEVDITINLDSCAKTHNAMRLIDAEVSHEIIIGKIKNLNLTEYGNIHFRATVTKNDTNLCNIVEHIVSLKVASSIQLALAVLPPESPYSIKAEDIPQFLAEKRKLSQYWLRYIKSNEPIWLYPLEDNMEKLLKHQVSFYYCGAGTRYLVVTPDGGLFICPGLITSPELAKDQYKFGDVYTGIDRKKQVAWITNYHVDKLEQCNSCWARYLCGGGCRWDSVLTNKEPTKPNPISCELIKADYEQAMAILIAVSEIDERIFKKRYAVNGFR